MKVRLACIALVMISLSGTQVYSQKVTTESITASELQSHLEFLASPLLKGRMNGDESLDIAANYIASQARLAGLKPANGDSYFQPFTVIRKMADADSSAIEITTASGEIKTIKEPFFNIIPQGPADFEAEGEVVFAGFGIRSDKYNDLENLDLKGKVVIVMDRGPMSNGNPFLGKEYYDSDMSFQYKAGALLTQGPKAIIFVPDPASGFDSFYEALPGIAAYLSSQVTLKGEKEQVNPMMAMMPKMIFAGRSVADALLEGSGKTLESIQNEINATLKPKSFVMSGTKIRVTEKIISEEKVLNNVAAYLEGSHPEKKKEVLVISAHYDHVGGEGANVHPGADDNASGCSALLEMAEAFAGLKKNPLRSLLFLWVAGEEVGLFGSQTYVNNPLFPLSETIANLNMDMVGRNRQPADSTDETPMTGPDEIFVITGGQSSELSAIAAETDKKSPLSFNYSLSGRDNPLMLFQRSDHFNFVKNDIPVLFFTTGLHTDYHTPGDVPEKIDYSKMELVTRTMFDIGVQLASRKDRIIVDNPYSGWNE